MAHATFVVYQEGEYFVSKCLNAEVSSFGKTIEEAIANLKEAVDLYLEDHPSECNQIGYDLLGEVGLDA